MSETSRNILLYAGIVVGIALTLWSSIDAGDERERATIGGRTVAAVNGQPVPSDLFAVHGEAGDKASLDRFLAEQLLLERAVSLGLIERDKKLRASVLEAMREFVAGVSPIGEPSEADLRAHYELTKTDYIPPPRYSVSYVTARGEQAGDNDIFAATEPTRMLPKGVLRRSIGMDAAELLADMAIGETRAFERGDETLYLRLEDRRDAAAPAFETIRARVLEDWFRLEENKRYEAYLKALLESADVAYAPEYQP